MRKHLLGLIAVIALASCGGKKTTPREPGPTEPGRIENGNITPTEQTPPEGCKVPLHVSCTNRCNGGFCCDEIPLPPGQISCRTICKEPDCFETADAGP